MTSCCALILLKYFENEFSNDRSFVLHMMVMMMMTDFVYQNFYLWISNKISNDNLL